MTLHVLCCMKAVNPGVPAPASSLYEQVEPSGHQLMAADIIKQRILPVEDERVVALNRATTTPRYSRRLSDKILIAFHHACDQGDLEVAQQLLHVLDMMLTRRPLTLDGNRRRNMESLVEACERLWHLRHPGSGEGCQPRADQEGAGARNSRPKPGQ
jgi:hypothetical protein